MRRRYGIPGHSQARRRPVLGGGWKLRRWCAQGAYRYCHVVALYLHWVAEAQSEPEGESCVDTGVPSVYVVGVVGRWRVVSWAHHGKHGHHKVDREQRGLSHG